MRSLRQVLILLLRLLLGAVLLYAAATKWATPRAFAEDVANYRLLPAGLVPLFTAALLGMETLLGVLLVSGLWAIEAAILTTALMGMFSLAVLSALARNLKIECGCFGAGGSPATYLTLLRDVLFSGAAALLLWLRRRPA